MRTLSCVAFSLAIAILIGMTFFFTSCKKDETTITQPGDTNPPSVSIQHPVAGDATYGGRRTPCSRRASSRQALNSLSRPALHAARLVFEHPATGRRLTFESRWPEDLAAVLDALR